MKFSIITILFGIALAAMPAQVVPYFLTMLAIVLCLSPLVVMIAVPVHLASRNKARRKASREFTEAYHAWKRAEADPYADASTMQSIVERAYFRLRNIKP
jgi:type IV secretory pathway VirB3-like protein